MGRCGSRGAGIAEGAVAALRRTILVTALASALFGGVAAPAVAQRSTPDSFADLAERVLPAVVNISTTQIVRNEGGNAERPGGGGRGAPQVPPGMPFEDLFRDYLERSQPRSNTPPRRVQSLGSGFVIDPSGYIVTNNHVVKDADEIVIRFHDDTQLEAKVAGRDTKTDLALLKVEPKRPLVSLKWGDSDTTRVGDWVIAVGNPFGLGGSVTAGILSARQRDFNSGPYDDYLQTDAAINRGNSGGPMMNTKGDVIGINTAIYSPTGGSIGIGFAVPSALASPVLAQLKESGIVKRGWMGVRIQSVNDDIAESLKLGGAARGALVASVDPKGPAAKAGIEGGDIILTFDGKEVNKMRRLPRVVAETPVNKTVKVEIWRKEQTITKNVLVAELKDDEEPKQTASTGGRRGGAAAELSLAGIGLSVSAIDDTLREKFDLGSDAKGVVVTKVEPAGPAGEKDLKPGDVILEINQDEVQTPAELNTKLGTATRSGKKSVLLLVDRKGDRRYVALNPGKS
jgi:serine protease Do